jgi:ABC-type oligopeptide transport system substrate-binding subunit
VGAYTTPQYRELLERELSAASTEERMKVLSELEQQLISDAFMIPLVNLKQFNLVSKRVQNYRADHQRFANDIRSADLEIVE